MLLPQFRLRHMSRNFLAPRSRRRSWRAREGKESRAISRHGLDNWRSTLPGAGNWWMRFRSMRIMFAGVTRNRIGRIPRLNDMAPSPADFVIRPIEHDDAGALAALELRCVGTAQWGEAAYRGIGANRITGWGA